MDFLLAGTLDLLRSWSSMPGDCPAVAAPPALRLWKTFRSKPDAVPVEKPNLFAFHRNGVRLQTGMLFGITTEWCSASGRIRVRLQPDSSGLDLLIIESRKTALFLRIKSSTSPAEIFGGS
jgi:hypothetical protein